MPGPPGPFTNLYGLGTMLCYGLTGRPPPLALERKRNPNPEFPVGMRGNLCLAIVDAWGLHGSERPGNVNKFRRRIELGR